MMIRRILLAIARRLFVVRPLRCGMCGAAAVEDWDNRCRRCGWYQAGGRQR